MLLRETKPSRELIGRPSKYMCYHITTSTDMDGRKSNRRASNHPFDILDENTSFRAVHGI